MIEITQEEVMKNWGVDNSDTPLVSIQCCTYNQEQYISDALDGFLIQKTNFPFEVIVHDDASTDKTASIIKEYENKFPQIIKPIYETENQYSKHDGSLSRIVNAACKGKYIAYCEGDDYWIDENKLQMQCDFLENNHDYGLCYTKAKCFIQTKQKFVRKAIGTKALDFEDLLCNGNKIPTLTVVFRKNLTNNYNNEINPSSKNWLMGDYPKWLYISHESKIYFFDIITSCYRILTNSASHSNNIEKKIAFEKSVYEIRKFYSEKYGIKINEFDENSILFYIYYSALLKNYDKEKAKKLIICSKKIENKNVKVKIISFFSKSYFLFKFFSIIK